MTSPAHFDPAPGSRRRWAIYAIASLGFVLSMFYRMSTAIISPALAAEMSLSSIELGKISAAFFYAFAASQIPLGLALDRFGSRLTMAFMGLFAVAGAILFATGHNLDQLLLARIFLGIGMSGGLMVPLALLAAWFSVDRFAFLGGIFISIGSLGNLLAATPLALMAGWLGWRGTFWMFAAINAVVVAVFLVVVRDRPPGQAKPRFSARDMFAGLGRLIRMYPYWAIGISNFFRYGYFASLQSLWAGPFLIYGLGLDQIQAGNAILAMGLGYMTGLPLCGRISDRYLRTRKWVILPTLVVFCLILVSISFWGRGVSMVLILGMFFLMGFFAAPGQIMYAHFKELLPPEMTSRAFTMLNIFPVLGTGLLTHFLGLVIPGEASQLSSPGDFSMLWYVGAAGVGLACLLYAPVPDSQALKKPTT